MTVPRVLTEKELHTAIGEDCGLLICCAGFEDRAFKVASCVQRSPHTQVRIIRLLGGDAANDRAFARMEEAYGKIMPEETIDYDLASPATAGSQLVELLSDLYIPEDRSIYLDISGFPGHGVCQVLYALRLVFASHRVTCLYTEAADYYPKKEEYEKSIAKNGELKTEKLPDSLTYEAKENLILPVFSGFSVRQDRTCLFLLAGFEKHRSVTALDGINPTRLLVIYGTPPNPKMHWREKLSRDLHADLFANIERAEESIETYDLYGMLGLFEQYYFMLYNEMSIVVCPINAKLHTVASYLFWERFRDVQLCFPLPVRYIPERSSVGSGHIYAISLPLVPQVTAFRGR